MTATITHLYFDRRSALVPPFEYSKEEHSETITYDACHYYDDINPIHKAKRLGDEALKVFAKFTTIEIDETAAIEAQKKFFNMPLSTLCIVLNASELAQWYERPEYYCALIFEIRERCDIIETIHEELGEISHGTRREIQEAIAKLNEERGNL